MRVLILYDAYTSTTKDECYSDNMEVQIHISAVKNGVDFEKYDNGENEVLYKRGSQFYVDLTSKEVGIYHIWMKEANDE